MPRQLDPITTELLQKYHPNPRAAVWDCHGAWVVYHKDVEMMAAVAGVSFDAPIVLEANGQTKCVALCVTARLPDGKSNWATGEAAPGNNKNAYPFAMAEKRARDRAILKLLGLSSLYSEDEAEDFKKHQPEPEIEIPADQKADTITAYIAVFKEAVSHAQTVEELRPMWKEGDYARGKLGIVPASTVYGDLYALWVARGKELSAAHNIIREAAE